MKSIRRFGSRIIRKHTVLTVAIILLAALLAGAWAAQPALGAPLRSLIGMPNASAPELLARALERTRNAGSYALNISLDQTVTPEDPFGMQTKQEWVHFDIRGEVAGADSARFAISPGRTSFGLASPETKEILIRGGDAYEWAGAPAEGDATPAVEHWAKIESAPATLGLDSDGLSLLAAAREVILLDPVEGLPLPGGRKQTYQRVGFNLAADDILRQMLAQRGALTAEALLAAQRNGPKITGDGELWIAADGYPARLILNLAWLQKQDVYYRVRAHTETDYTRFGERFSAARFDPLASPTTGSRPAGVPDLVSVERLQTGLWLPIGLALLGLLWLVLRSVKGDRRAFKAVTILMVALIMAPTFANVAQADQLDRGAQPAARADTANRPLPGQEVAEMLRDAREIRSGMTADDPNPANALTQMGDEDGDGLPNGYEVEYGTNPFTADSDFDTLSDYDELMGIACKGDNNLQTTVKSNPMNPDSNQDGLMDGEEFHRGKCTRSYTLGWMWDDDNDDDGVPDGLDLSPYSWSSTDVLYLGGNWQAPNMTFETLDQNPNDEITTPYPFYVELQIRPRQLDSLRWAYKYVTWPHDEEASIQQTTNPAIYYLKKLIYGVDIGTSGEVKLVPFMQATVRERDLPTAKTMQPYGVSASPHKDANGSPAYENGEALYDMVIPLMTVTRGGQAFAFQAKMLHDRRPGNDSLTRHWRDVRLKWAAVADVLLPDPNNNNQYVPSPNAGYGLWVYDEAYDITGMQVTRQGGASMLVATALPSNQPYDDGPIALLRGGLEAQFLPGGISLSDIKNRFNTPNGATPEERWGIPQSVQYRVVYDASMNYGHVDQALATTTMTTTKQLLDNEFASESGLDPTFLYASEQRTSTVNLDDDPPNNYLDITLNTCLKPLVTSRSLKMQTYDWVIGKGDLFGHWEPMSLDDVLAKVENAYAASTDPNYVYYQEQLIILKLVTTTWQLGVTSILKIGELSFIDINNILTNPELVLAFLGQDGLVPTEFKSVVDQLLKIWSAGGPVVWLEAQWKTVVDVANDVDHFFQGSYLDLDKKTPDSYIKVIPMGEQPPGGGDPVPPAEPIDLKIMGYTATALKLLGMLASIIGNETFSTVIQVLTKIVQIYQQFRALVDTIKSIIKISETAGSLQAAATAFTAAKELKGMTQGLNIVGLIFAVAVIWIAVLVQIGDLGPNVALAVVVRAIVETVLAVVLFVVAAIFPYGTIVAIAIGLIKMIESLIGFQFDPISLLLSWLFDVEAVSRTDTKGDPIFGNLTLTPLEAGGGIISGADFRIQLPGKITMQTVNGGTKNDLGQSNAELHVGRFNDWPDNLPNICTPSKELFAKYKEAVGGFFHSEFHAAETHCVHFTLPTQGFWFTASHLESKGAVKSVGAHYERTDDLLGRLDVSPSQGINKRLVLDISMDVTIRYDQCANVGGCDAYISESTSPPAFSEFLFDFLPSNINGLWKWDETQNWDIDGDGISGYKYPGSNTVYGPDANLCPNLPAVKSWDDWDSDNDGLSDYFEKTTKGFNPCNADTDNDGLKDGVELLIGTYPNDADTDNDGLTDKEETPFDNGFNIQYPWTVQLSTQYPGLPNPPAFPNPRQQNADGDHRNDKQEKAKQSSPTSYNAVPVGAPVTIGISQNFKPDGSQTISIQSSAWENVEAIALNTTLVLTLPVPFGNVSQPNVAVKPLLPLPQLNYGAPQPPPGPNVYRWAVPPMSKGRWLHATLTGMPTPPGGPVNITAALEYDEGATHQVATAETPLVVNLGGPVVTFTNVQGAIVQSGLAAQNAGEAALRQAQGARGAATIQADGIVTISGLAEDPDRVTQVFVCVKTTDTCAGADWKPAYLAALAGGEGWTYDFNPPADNTYFVRAYGVDGYGKSGAIAGPLVIGVDQTPPAGVAFDLGDTVYISTTVVDGLPPAILLTGSVQEALGAPYVSGLASVGLLFGQESRTAAVAQPGQGNSAFSLAWTPPLAGTGVSMRARGAWSETARPVGSDAGLSSPAVQGGSYELHVAASDVAGNASTVSDTIRLVVDDTPPVVYARPPQIFGSTTMTLSGLADDTALVADRAPEQPLASHSTTNDAETQFNTAVALGKAVVVGDVNGDAIDDVALLAPATIGLAPVPFRAGLFFGKPGGLPATLALANADVLFQGETPVATTTLGPAAARVGDVNGDGVDDLLLGDPATDTGKGRAYVVFGRRSGWTTPINLSAASWRLSVAGTVGFGGTVAGAGDTNGDGLADILIGAAQSLDGRGGAQNGGAWLYLGREQAAPTAPRLAFTPPGATFAAPPELAGVGDANGDGLSDFLIAFQNTAVALVHGRITDGWPAGSLPLGTQASALLAAAGNLKTVARAGDVNADGLADMLIGDPTPETPRVFLLYGRRSEQPWPILPAALNLIAQADASWAGPRGSRLGAGLTDLGDVDRDGRADFAFGQPGTGSGPNRAALVLTESFSPTLNLPVESATQLISGTAASQLLGEYLSAGDVSGDHVPDLLAGAPGAFRAFLFLGDFDPGTVAGVTRVEIGWFGPVTNPALPVSATLPAAWTSANLTSPNAAITAWTGQLTAGATGDYRVYARALDRAGNRGGVADWYIGNIWVTGAVAAFNGNVTLNAPSLTDQTRLAMSGTLSTTANTQHFRVFDGYAWRRLPPVPGAFAETSTLPHSDRRNLTLRAIARDAFGATAQAQRNLLVDTFVAAPVLSATLPANVWQTNVSPNLVVTWPAPTDASGIAGVFAVIDTVSNTVPTTVAVGNQVSRLLNAAGVYYAHVRVRDNAGNEATTHAGPYLVNRTQTPSVIQPDGVLMVAGGEYPNGTLLNYDPYAGRKPAALWGTWDATRLYLGFPGRNWDQDNRLALYFDTQPGGLTSSLPISGALRLTQNAALAPEAAHTLPFAADYALVVGGATPNAFTLYRASGSWTPLPAPQSFVVREMDTEMVLDRAEIGAVGAVALVAVAEDEDGAWAVLPAAARPTTDTHIVGPMTLAAALQWPGLANGVSPNAGLSQFIAPQVVVVPDWDNVVVSGRTAGFQVVVRNPDIAPYSNAPLDLQVDARLALVSVAGAACQSCPPGASQWTLLANVAPGAMQTVTVQARVLGEGVSGVVPLQLSAGLANSGLPGKPQQKALSQFQLDHGSVAVGPLSSLKDIFVKPGAYQIPVSLDIDFSTIARCVSDVEVNPGATGWLPVCKVGDCTVVTGSIPAGSTQGLQIRATGSNGRSSTPAQINVIADATPPTVQISATQVLSGSLAFVQGIAWDTFPTTRAPVRVEVSLGSGRFRPAVLSTPRGGALRQAQGAAAVEGEQAAGATMTHWRYPLHLTWEDGKTMQIVARAVDEAGNVSSRTTPMSVILDNVGPKVTLAQSGEELRGTIRDGSGVAGLRISLDGGAHYLPAVRQGENWTFDLRSWSGAAAPWAFLVATDIYGNVTHTLAPVGGATRRVFLPLVQRTR